MAFQHGKNVYLSVDGTDVSSYADAANLARQIAMAVTTSFGDSDETSIPGVRNGTFTIGGGWDPALDAVIIGTDDGATFPFVVGPEGNTTGDIQYTGTALIDGYTIDMGTGDKVGYSGSFTITGAVTRGAKA